MAEENPSQAPLLRAPTGPLWGPAVRFGLIGLTLGLLIAAVFVVIDQLKANSVSPGFVQARIVVLQYQAEKGVWPKDCDLSAPGEQFAGFRLTALSAALAKCEVPGSWAFSARSAAGFPAIVFTPSAPGRSFERTLRVVDGWIDDGSAATGEMRVGPAAATLRLSAE
jgi:hypothetical protein